MAGVVTMVHSEQLMFTTRLTVLQSVYCMNRTLLGTICSEQYLRINFLPSERQSSTEWLTALHTGYQQSALNCWIAALLYLVTLAVAAHQLWSNQQAAEQFKVHSNCVLLFFMFLWNLECSNLTILLLFLDQFTIYFYHWHIYSILYFLLHLTSRSLFILSIGSYLNDDNY